MPDIRKNEPAYPITAMIYFYYPGEEHSYYISPLGKNSELFGFQGSTLELDDFFIHMHPASNANQGRLFTGVVPREDKIMETVYSVFGLGKGDGKSNSPTMDKDTNIWIYELSTNFSSPNIKSDNILLEVEFTRFQTAAKSFSGDEFTKELNNQRNMFHQQFAKKFKINLNKFTERQVNLSKIAVSNLLGGIGYFYGSSLVRSGSIQDTKPVSNWPAGLFTATPSRSMFPRGFLWDEGFHGLITSRWDPRLAMETVGHWLDLLNVNGWIPREQILGFESRSRVPDEFVVQTDGIANPPSLILVIESILDNLPKLTALERIEFRSWSIVVLPRLHVWYQWFNTTQKGPLPLTYRWRGRNSKEIHQLNPLTLSSGLDDYPRASHPSDDERHLDLRCWMTLFARIITKLASVVAQTMQTDLGSQGIVQSQLDETRSLIAHYKYWADCLSDQSELDKLHWSDKFQRYADYGLHTDSVRMQVLPDVNKHIPNDDVEQIRVADQNPSLKLVTSSFGYVNLFPLLFRMIAPNSNRLPILLSDLGNPDLLWTNYGIRSLDPQSLFYKKSNTIHDPPYWRGPIWINLNYIIVKSLKYYANHPRTPSDIAQTASNLGDQLGHNLVRTVLGELERTGFLWEQYNDETGRGQRGHPFSGWTSLISLIISDIP